MRRKEALEAASAIGIGDALGGAVDGLCTLRKAVADALSLREGFANADVTTGLVVLGHALQEICEVFDSLRPGI